jgi:hypothetical protein
MKKFFLGLMLIFFSAFAQANEVSCVGETFSFYIRVMDGLRVGHFVLTDTQQLLQRVQMTEMSVKEPEFESLAKMLEGKTSEDSFKLYVFNEKENKLNISFLVLESVLGAKKTIEMRCKI